MRANKAVYRWRPAAYWILPVLLLAFLASGCTTGINPVSGNRRALGYSWEEEKKLGQQADQQIQQQFGFYDDENLNAYVRRVGQEVLQESHLRRPDTPEKFRNTEFTFRVLDSPVINAMALPGGYVYVTRGLMAHLNNEAQLSLVLGHEVAHVAARHASQQAAKQQFAQLGLIAGAIGGEIAGLSGGSILQLGSQAAQLLFLSYSRDNEREADRLGVEYASLAGYKAQEGAAFFHSLERIQEQSGQDIPTWQSTHPDPGDRQERVAELAQQWAPKAPEQRVQQEEYYSSIEGIVLGQNPRQGFTQSGMFYHPELRFQFPVPRNFSVTNQPTVVAIVAPDQQAVIQFTISEGSSAQAAARQLAGQEGIQVIEQGPARSGRLPAYAVEARAQTQQGQTLHLLSYYVEYDGNVYNFLGVTEESRYATYENIFLDTMRGFAPLNDPEILNVEPTRLEIHPAGRTAAFQSFLPSPLPRDLTAEGVAIMNQVRLDQQIERGRPLKLPQR